MFQKILLTLDESELSEAVLPWVQTLVEEGVEATVLWVQEPEIESTEERQQRVDAMRGRLKRAVDFLVEGGGEAGFRILEGDPAEVIVDVGEERGVSLVAMATHGRSGVSRWVRGSVAERVLRTTRAPLLLVNPHSAGKEPDRVRRILVPLDGSETAGRILPLVSAFARQHGATVTLLHVTTPGASEAAAAALLEAERAQLQGEGLQVQLAVRQGAADEQILEAADDLEVGLVAMTSHGRTGVPRWLYGSVAENVVRHCSRPLLVQRVVAPTEPAVS